MALYTKETCLTVKNREVGLCLFLMGINLLDSLKMMRYADGEYFKKVRGELTKESG